MTLLDVFAIVIVSAGAAWTVRELARGDRAGREVQGRYGRWTRLPGVHDEKPF